MGIGYPASFGRPPPPGASHGHAADSRSSSAVKESGSINGPHQYMGWSRPPAPPHGYALPPIYSYERPFMYETYGYRPPYDPSLGPYGGLRPPVDRRRSSASTDLKVSIPKTDNISPTALGFPSNPSTPATDSKSSNPSPTELSRFYPVYAGRISVDTTRESIHESQPGSSPKHPGERESRALPLQESSSMRQDPYGQSFYNHVESSQGNNPFQTINYLAC
jgi:hypothetical protein